MLLRCVSQLLAQHRQLKIDHNYTGLTFRSQCLCYIFRHSDGWKARVRVNRKLYLKGSKMLNVSYYSWSIIRSSNDNKTPKLHYCSPCTVDLLTTAVSVCGTDGGLWKRVSVLARCLSWEGDLCKTTDFVSPGFVYFPEPIAFKHSQYRCS
jgi:hypothetical protein